jgi:IS30 family transposase
MPTYSRLTREQRYTIEAMNRNGSPQNEIANAIGKHPSTVSRELRRLGVCRDYCSVEAQRDAESKTNGGKRCDAALLDLAASKLREDQWSPEQISAWIKREGLGALSHETFYQHVYRDKARGGSLHLHLRHRYKAYRKRGSGRERRGRLKDQVMIDQRPVIVDERSRIGDWEMDTVIGRSGGPVLVTMVERFSRYTLIALCASREASEVGAAILRSMNPHREKVLTTTYDNGKEFALHKLLAEILEADAYFAHPYHSWERGLNENTNGLIRQYFPKGTDFAKVTSAQVKKVERKLNRRPRKCLDYRTPHDIFNTPPPVALAA